VFEIVWNGVKRLAAFLTGEGDQVVFPEELESLATRIPDKGLSTLSIASSEVGPVVDMSRWTVTEYVESPFEKIGRIYLVGGDMVIRSDLDSRGFRVPLADVDAVLAGNPQDIRLLKTGKKVGTVQLSTSGRGLNFSIDPFFYTTPLRSVMRTLSGEQRKAPLFVGREQVEGN
jgi:hypothetical protein